MVVYFCIIDKFDGKNNGGISDFKVNNVKIIRVSEMIEMLDYISTTYGKTYLKQFRNGLKT
jgi:hypothetical protein